MRKYKENWKQIVFGLWLFVSMGLTLYVIARNSFNLFNSDDASEILLAEILSHGNCVFDRGWVASTEISIINTQIIRAILFWFTDSWLMVRIVGNAFLMLWLLLSYAAMLWGSGIEKKWFWYTAPFLIMPFSHEHFYMIALTGYYIPYIALSFLIIGLWGYLYRTQEESSMKRRTLKRGLAHMALLVTSFLSCLCGIRQFLITFFPMMGALVFQLLSRSRELSGGREFFKRTYFLWTSTLAGLAAYAVNMKVLCKLFIYNTYGEMNLVQLMNDKIQVIVRYFLNACGYVEEAEGTPLFSLSGIQYLMSLGMIVLFVVLAILLGKNFKGLKPASQFIYLSALLGLGLNAFVGLFTDISFAGRYFIPNLILFAPLLAVFYEEIDMARWMKRAAFGIFVVMVCFLGMLEYKNSLENVQNESRRGSLAYIEEKDYALGYATFWNANILTELTNGKQEMVSLQCERDGDPDLMPWLVKLDNLLPQENRGPVFLYLYKNELNRYHALIEGREPVYEDDYYIYEFEGTDEFLGVLKGNEEE